MFEIYSSATTLKVFNKDLNVGQGSCHAARMWSKGHVVPTSLEWKILHFYAGTKRSIMYQNIFKNQDLEVTRDAQLCPRFCCVLFKSNQTLEKGPICVGVFWELCRLFGHSFQINLNLNFSSNQNPQVQNKQLTKEEDKILHVCS